MSFSPTDQSFKGICPTCAQKYMGAELADLRSDVLRMKSIVGDEIQRANDIEEGLETLLSSAEAIYSQISDEGKQTTSPQNVVTVLYAMRSLAIIRGVIDE